MGVAIVQKTSNGHNVTDGTTVTIHYGAAPTAGNLLLAIANLSDVNGAPNPPAGWTLYASADSATTTMWMVVLYRYAQAGDSANQQIDNSGRQFWGLTAWEISGVSGVIGTDVAAAHLYPTMAGFPATTGAAGPFNTGAANELVVASFNSNASSAATTGVTSTGFVADSNFNGSDSAFCSAYGGHYLEPTSGTTISVSTTYSQNSGGYGGFVELGPTNTNATAHGALGSNLTIGNMTATASGASNGTATGALGSNLTIGNMTAVAVANAAIKSSKVVAYAAEGPPDGSLAAVKVVAGALTGPPDASLLAVKVVAYGVMGAPPPRRPAQVRVVMHR